MVDLDDTTRCKKADRCAGCGTTEGLTVETYGSLVGTACATVCGDRECRNTVGFGSLAALYDAVGAHAAHLGIDVDQMAAILAGGTDGGR